MVSDRAFKAVLEGALDKDKGVCEFPYLLLKNAWRESDESRLKNAVLPHEVFCKERSHLLMDSVQ